MIKYLIIFFLGIFFALYCTACFIEYIHLEYEYVFQDFTVCCKIKEIIYRRTGIVGRILYSLYETPRAFADAIWGGRLCDLENI